MFNLNKSHKLQTVSFAFIFCLLLGVKWAPRDPAVVQVRAPVCVCVCECVAWLTTAWTTDEWHWWFHQTVDVPECEMELYEFRRPKMVHSNWWGISYLFLRKELKIKCGLFSPLSLRRNEATTFPNKRRLVYILKYLYNYESAIWTPGRTFIRCATVTNSCCKSVMESFVTLCRKLEIFSDREKNMQVSLRSAHLFE